jgi:ABC-type transport system substrate-binding protein
MIGTGPFVLSEYVPSASFTFKRNPDFYDKDWALVEQINQPIVSEYASVLSQFKAGNIYSFGNYSAAPKVTPEDVLPTKREAPQISIFEGGLRSVGQPRFLAFGWLPAGKSPFQDERVRQAVSLAIDRDIYMDTFGNVSAFRAEGLPVQSVWNTALPAGNVGWWLDPQGKDFDPNAKYYKFDQAEAKKLLTAAGYPNGIQDLPSRYVASAEFPSGKHAEVYDAMIAEIGIASKVTTLDYAKEYIPQYRNGQGQHEGWLYRSTAGGFTGGEAAAIIATEYWSKAGVTFYGYSSNGLNDKSGDPQVESMIEKARLENDTEKRRALVFDLQRYLAKAQYAVPPPGQATSFEVAWPAVGNFGAFQGVGNFYIARPDYRLWVDETKPPFTKA